MGGLFGGEYQRTLIGTTVWDHGRTVGELWEECTTGGEPLEDCGRTM